MTSHQQPIVASLTRSLTTIEEGDANALLSRIAEVMLARVDAACAGSYQIVQIAGDCAVVAPSMRGDIAERTEVWMASKPGHRNVNDPFVRRAQSCPAGQLRNRFVPEHLAFDWELFEQTSSYRGLWQPLGIRHQLRMLAYDGTRLLGWMGLVRSRHAGPFLPAERRRLRSLGEPLRTALLTAVKWREAASPAESGDVLLRPDGSVGYASHKGREWLASELTRAALRVAAPRWDRHGLPSTAVLLGEAQARVLRLVGADGMTTRYLVHLSAAQPITLPPAAELTSKQRQVAELAASGATNAEMAAMLGVTAQTIKAHLRAIYERLMVSNRLELAQALENRGRPRREPSSLETVR